MVPRILTKLEALVQRLQLRYMNPRRTNEVVETGRIRFHPQDARERVLREYKNRLKTLQIS